MRMKAKGLALSATLAVGAVLGALPAFAQPVDTARIEAGGANDWLTYHGSYKGTTTAASTRSTPTT